MGASGRQHLMTPAETAAGNNDRQRYSFPPMVGAVDQVVSKLVVEVGASRPAACPSVLVVATGVFEGRMMPTDVATAVVKKIETSISFT